MTPYKQMRKEAKERAHQRDKDTRKAARRRGATVTETVRMRRLRALDNSTCYLCGLWVSRADASIDHLIPLAHGGAHTYENTRLTHKDCNNRKADRHPSEVIQWQ